MNSRAVVLLGLLVGMVCVLAYLEWWRAGELSELADRVMRVENANMNGHQPEEVPVATGDEPERPVRPEGGDRSTGRSPSGVSHPRPMRDSDARLKGGEA